MSNADDKYLVHYGILGMKWGVRRTPEQLGHKPRGKGRGKGGTTGSSSKDQNGKPKSKKSSSKSGGGSGEGKKKLKTTRDLTTQELQDIVNRLSLEKRYIELVTSNPRKTRAQNFVDNYIRVARTVADVTGPTLTSIRNVRSIMRILDDTLGKKAKTKGSK